jgi:hypothetical protein
MEVMFLEPEFVPVLGSLVFGGLLFLMAFGAMVYGWFSEEPARAMNEAKPVELGAIREMGRELREPARVAEEPSPTEMKKAA